MSPNVVTPRVFPWLRRAALASALPLATLTAPAPAAAQAPAAAAQATVAIEQIVGYDPARGVLVYVERTPSSLPGMQHVALVEVPRDGAAARRIPLTTDTDVEQVRRAPLPGREQARLTVEARVMRDVQAARANLRQGARLPASIRTGPPVSPCRRAPFGAREYDVGLGVVARVDVSADAMQSTVVLSSGGRAGAATVVPSVVLTQGATTTPAPYDHIADARELPGSDTIAVLLRSDACTPEQTPVPVRAVFLAAPPPPETPLTALTPTELPEAAVIRAIAPGARRRVVDGVRGWFDGRTRVTFDNAWTLPSSVAGENRLLVQFSRQSAELSPLLIDAGHATAHFALFTRRGRLRAVSILAPPASEQVFEGTGQEASMADLDGDGRPELMVRARFNRDDEIITVLRVANDHLSFVWRGLTRFDERATPTGANAEVRRCDPGVDGRTLVLRCTVDVFAAHAAADAAPLRTARLVQRLQWNGGMINLTEERR